MTDMINRVAKATFAQKVWVSLTTMRYLPVLCWPGFLCAFWGRNVTATFTFSTDSGYSKIFRVTHGDIAALIDPKGE